MNFIKNHKGLFLVLTNIFALLFVLTFIAEIILTDNTLYRTKVNEMLGTSDGDVVRSEDKEDYYYQSDYDSVSELAAAQEKFVAEEEEEGAVLLKGSASDLKVGGSLGVSLFGERSITTFMAFGSNMGATISTDRQVDLKTALENDGFSVNPTLYDLYYGKRGNHAAIKNNAFASVTEDVSEISGSMTTSDYANYKDAAIVVLGRSSAEGSTFYPGDAAALDASEYARSGNYNTGNMLALSDGELDLLSYVEQQGFSKVIVLINSACAMELQPLEEDDNIDSILWIGNPGSYGTEGVAELLKGSVLPSGHLTDTYAVNAAAAPAAQNFGDYQFSGTSESLTPDTLRAYCVESEGIYVGYKYYETRYYDSLVNATVSGAASVTSDKRDVALSTSTSWNYDNEVTYPFGYGIEGSTFTETIKSTDIDWTGDTDSTVEVEVTNAGTAAAKHVVQLYVQAPYTMGTTSLEKSAIQLVAYGKTSELAAGANETLTLTFNVRDFASYDTSYTHDSTKGAYVLEAGNYYFATGNGAHDALRTVMKQQDTDNNTAHLTDTATAGQPTGVAFKEALDVDGDGNTRYITTSRIGSTVENRMEDCEIDCSEVGTIFTSQGAKYLSRTSWVSTFPVTMPTGIVVPSGIAKYINCEQTYDSAAENAAYEAAGGKQYTASDFGQEGDVTIVDAVDLIRSAEEGEEIGIDNEIWDELMDEVPLETICNILTAGGSVIEEILSPEIKAADSPNGLVTKYGAYSTGAYTVEDSSDQIDANVYASEPVIAATFSHEMADKYGTMIGNDGLWTGIAWWFGPGLNIHRTQFNARNIEYYTEDSVLMGLMGTDIVSAAQAKGIVACTKHFAFNDYEPNRVGESVFMSEQAARENELRSWEMVVEIGKTKSIMTAFNRFGYQHTSCDYAVITGLVREEWGLQGLIITDSVKNLDYQRPDACLAAGTDYMLGGGGRYTNSYWSNVDPSNILSDSFLTDAARTAVKRYIYTFADSAATNGLLNEFSGGNPWWETALNSVCVVCGVLAVIGLAVWAVGEITDRRH